MNMEEIVFGYRMSQCAHVAVTTGVVEELYRRPSSVADLAAALDLNRPALRRLLNLLRAMDVVRRTGEGFELTGEGARLAASHPRSLAGPAQVAGMSWNWNSWGALRDVVATGRPAFPELYTDELFETSEMAEVGRNWYAASGGRGVMLARLMDFSEEKQVLDIGGGQGAYLAGILRVWPHLRGVVVDLPHVVADAPRTMASMGVESGYEVVAGDFRDRLPPREGTWILSGVLHSWGDADCVKILRCCHQGIENGGRLLLVDQMLDPDESDDVGLLLGDLHLMVFGEGRRRSVDEYVRLLDTAGFESRRLGALRSKEVVLEALPRAA